MTRQTPLFLAALLAAPAFAASNDRDMRRATVQIHFVASAPDYAQPWQPGRQEGGTGSGVVIEGRRILTNGHVVANAAYLSVRKSGDVKKYPARVAFVGHDGETAVITVDDESFFEGTTAAKFGGLPSQRDKVSVYGYPIGGADLSVTEGIVSRVGVTVYAHSARALLALQTDAAINPGNSGGPVFQAGRLIGIAFQHSAGAQNIGYVVPMPIIERFLKDIRDGRYDGIPDLGIWWQGTENDGLRKSLSLPADNSGVLVTKVAYGASAWDALKEGDALTMIDGVKIGQDGTIPFRDDERIDFSNLISRRQVGETVDAVVMREGRQRVVKIPMRPSADLVPGPRYDAKPSYFIVGGLVFMPLSDELIAARGAGFRVRSLSADGAPAPERTEVVVLSHVLAHDFNRGYHSWSMAPVTRVNGRPIGKLTDLVAAFQAPVAGRHEIELEHYSGRAENKGSRIVLDAETAAKVLPAILARYGVPFDRSGDLKKP
ncbi:MAG: trypsin-like peptidase domain-containing protein [Elusimicrobia bacterium]|nr:trypsin-like peptidase domain-containing protein [Elusimicrobiota bacterium]